MTWIILCLLLALVCFSLEILLPGGILGAFGALFALVGTYLTFASFDTATAIVTLLGTTLLGTLILYFEFRILPKTRIGKRAFLNHQIDANCARYTTQNQALIGKSATVLTPLCPSGYISIDGKRYEACCQSGFAKIGESVTVSHVDNFQIFVSQPLN